MLPGRLGILMSMDTPPSRRLRFDLRTLLILVTLFGILAAWLTDRYRLNTELNPMASRRSTERRAVERSP